MNKTYIEKMEDNLAEYHRQEDRKVGRIIMRWVGLGLLAVICIPLLTGCPDRDPCKDKDWREHLATPSTRGAIEY